MAYVKNIWLDQDVERPKTYEVTNNQDGSITLTDSFGIVTELGTPVNEVNMNHIEDGIDGCAIRKHNLTETFNLGEWVLGGTGDDEGIYKSLVSNNVGNAISDETKWEKVSIGGGGLEIGDIGIAPLGIDETQNKRRYLNGQVIIQDQYVSFTNKLKSAVALYPSLACTEAQWQTTATLSVGGQVGKFVIDDTAGTIRLPKIIMPIQGLTNLANLAEIVEAGLPNITGYFVSSDDTFSYCGGAFYTGGSGGKATGGNADEAKTLMDASRSSSIYGNSTTVQQEQIQYPYFIQVATGVEESVDVTREIELNNPFSLFDYKYSEYELDNISWLRSNGQYNPKAVYTDAYDYLLREYNNPDRLATFNSSAFTVVGSPTITSDGIASGFSDGSYIKTNTSIPVNKDFVLSLEYTITQDFLTKYALTQQYLIGGTYNPTNDVVPVLFEHTNSTDKFIRFTLTVDNNGTNQSLMLNSAQFDVVLGDKIKAVLSRENGIYKAQYYKNGTQIGSDVTSNNTNNLVFESDLIIGQYKSNWANQPFNGSIDLKKFSITVDGERVLSGANSKVKLSTETYADTDFVLNTTNETFRLPLKVALASGKAVVGNGMTLGLTDGTLLAGLGKVNNSNLGYPINIYSNNYGSSIGSNLSGDITGINKSVGITTDPTKSGIELSDANLYLYFYVGETVQNANLINAGRIEEKLTTIIPDNSNLIASYGMPDYANRITITSGFTAPSMGWISLNCWTTTSGTNTNVYINGIQITGIGTAGGAVSNATQIPVNKGDVITYNNGGYTSLFFPMKGAN